MSLDTKLLKSLYFDMYAIRRFEEEVETYSKNGTIPGFIHLSIGQEAAQAGAVTGPSGPPITGSPTIAATAPSACAALTGSWSWRKISARPPA